MGRKMHELRYIQMRKFLNSKNHSPELELNARFFFIFTFSLFYPPKICMGIEKNNKQHFGGVKDVYCGISESREWLQEHSTKGLSLGSPSKGSKCEGKKLACKKYKPDLLAIL